jgi:hypothetical protein
MLTYKRMIIISFVGGCQSDKNGVGARVEVPYRKGWLDKGWDSITSGTVRGGLLAEGECTVWIEILRGGAVCCNLI